jgi:hypothetical protein
LRRLILEDERQKQETKRIGKGAALRNGREQLRAYHMAYAAVQLY